MNRTRLSTVALALSALLSVSACAGTTEERNDAAISVENCGDTVTFDEVPERVTLLDNPSVSALAALDVLDRVTAKAGVYPTEYYSPEVGAQLEQIPTLTDQVDTSGHLQISREMVVATEPDLVIGSSDTVNRQTLGTNGIPLLDEPAFCGSLRGEVTFEDAYDQVMLYGTVFDREEAAAAYIRELKDRVAAVMETVPDSENRSVAVLYPTTGSSVTYAYGTGSMSHPLVSAAGLENVFGSETERVFEVTGEELIDRDPDVIITLYSAGDSGPVIDAVEGLPGAGALTAVKNQTIFPMLLSFAEPPSPLAVDGLEKLSEYLEETR
ncbi:ABC transporter substrate-binding protein [Corynebacterium comes]|uniref:Corrinoid ABC transporter substrate-binding protein n=1 Tax=Corynebacterium comes TaxID=2675218 RepID=A0A6B8VRE2_9CORY|nr:ABC transporter substrate-binding protein [Corynebacterium comes]QGU05629.1 corrinoid ABC transporter substrate-binding protein [Corynebacterium comes]